MKVVTVEAALNFLTRGILQGTLQKDSTFILSLTDSEIEDATINDLVIIDNGNNTGYVEVRCQHPSLSEGP